MVSIARPSIYIVSNAAAGQLQSNVGQSPGAYTYMHRGTLKNVSTMTNVAVSFALNIPRYLHTGTKSDCESNFSSSFADNILSHEDF